MGQTWNKLLNALRVSEDGDEDQDKKIGRDIRSLVKAKDIEAFQEYLASIKNELKEKDELIRLLEEKIAVLEKDSRVMVDPPDSETSDEGALVAQLPSTS